MLRVDQVLSLVQIVTLLVHIIVLTWASLFHQCKLLRCLFISLVYRVETEGCLGHLVAAIRGKDKSDCVDFGTDRICFIGSLVELLNRSLTPLVDHFEAISSALAVGAREVAWYVNQARTLSTVGIAKATIGGSLVLHRIVIPVCLLLQGGRREVWFHRD